MPFPFELLNQVGSFPDAEKYMSISHWLYSMAKGNFLSGGGMEEWPNGTSFSDPVDATALSKGWTLEKVGGTPAEVDFEREATIVDTGLYSMLVDMIDEGSPDSFVRVVQEIPNFARFARQTLAFAVRVNTQTASKVRVYITDGVTDAYSEYHTGSGEWEKLQAIITCAEVPTELTVKIEVLSDFDGDQVYLDSGFLYVSQSTAPQDALDALEYFSPDDPFTLSSAALTLSSLTMTGDIDMDGNRILNFDELNTGWVSADETWTYASASTFTVSGDQTAKYSKGTRLKFTQTTVKYAVVVASSYGAPNTTVTILVNTDYTIANAAITAPFYSYTMNPQGYPDYFNLAAPTFDTGDIDNGTGGVQPTTTRHVGSVTGKTFRSEWHGNGVKNGAGRTFNITAISSYPTPATGDTVRAVIGLAYFTESDHSPQGETGVIVKTVSSGQYSLIEASETDIGNNTTIDPMTFKTQYQF